MKREIIIGLMLSLLTSMVVSQETEKFDYEFLGVLLLSDSELYSYKLEFNIHKDSIKGYSYTDIGGENETKSYVFGSFDKKKKEVSFKEKEVLYTKSYVSLDDEFCFITSKGVLKLRSKKNSYTSTFEAFNYEGKACASGDIKLVGTQFIENRLKKIYKKAEKIKRIDSVTKEKIKPNKVLEKFGKTTISDEEIITVFLKSNKAKFEIWDYGKEDGDIVDVYINEKKILENLKIKRNKKTLFLNLKEGTNTIKITTVSSGSIQSNTAKVKLYDSKRFYELKSNIRKGKSAEIHIIYKKE